MVQLKSSSTVKPAGPTPHQRLWLSDLDLIQPVTHAPTVYFYRPHHTSIAFFSPELLKNALSQVLVKFYPLAGRLLPGPNGRLELECNAMGAQFLEAESDARLDDLGDFTPSPNMREFVPGNDYNTHISEWPLLQVQVTFFRCGGVCMGIGMAHTVVDGMAALHFIATWARIARGDAFVGVDPFFDRTILRARDPPVPPAFKHEEFGPRPLLMGHVDDHEIRNKETTVELLRLTGEQVNKIKQKAPGHSRFQAMAGHVWRTACRARGLHQDQWTKMSFSVDVRNKLHPPLPDGYFGNSILNSMPAAQSGELVSNPLSYAAGLVKESVAMMTDEYLRSVIDFLGCHEDLTPFRRGSHTLGCGKGLFYGCPNLAFTSWLGLPMYDADFGWGPPVHMGPAGVGFEGKVFLMPTQEGDGSLLIAIRLMVDHMKAFKELIYDGI